MVMLIAASLSMNRPKLFAATFSRLFLARDFLKKNPGSPIVYDLRSSRVVKEEILNAGGVPKRERVGHVFMKKALADSRAVFGGELSGHFYFRDSFKTDSARHRLRRDLLGPIRL